MAYWGESLTYNQPLWGEQDLDAARAALVKLAATPEERATKAGTARERGYLLSVEQLYGKGDKTHPGCELQCGAWRTLPRLSG